MFKVNGIKLATLCRLVAQKSVSFFRNVFSNIQNPDASFGLKEENISSDYVTVSHLTRHDVMTAAQVVTVISRLTRDNSTQTSLSGA